MYLQRIIGVITIQNKWKIISTFYASNDQVKSLLKDSVIFPYFFSLAYIQKKMPNAYFLPNFGILMVPNISYFCLDLQMFTKNGMWSCIVMGPTIWKFFSGTPLYPIPGWAPPPPLVIGPYIKHLQWYLWCWFCIAESFSSILFKS